jgi:hypothetical protein
MILGTESLKQNIGSTAIQESSKGVWLFRAYRMIKGDLFHVAQADRPVRVAG